MQREMNLLGSIDSEIKDLPWDHVAACDTEQQAMRMCIRRAKVFRTQESIAELLGMTKGALGAILASDRSDRKRHASRVMQIELQRICGNSAIDQWAELYAKGMLNCQRSKEDRKAELLAELAKLEGAA